MPAKVHTGRVKRTFRGFNTWKGEIVETDTRNVYLFEVPLKSFADVTIKATVKFTLHPQPGPEGKRGKKLAKITRLI